ncbi:hypothetical protein [Sphingomonas adhaesiva]|uniref:hypothetical protein n=1 Tax=Sphingomonas adhaesiva TaxID=28212 RepID=UPI002FF811CC
MTFTGVHDDRSRFVDSTANVAACHRAHPRHSLRPQHVGPITRDVAVATLRGDVPNAERRLARAIDPAPVARH